jgi:hypothetical protein
MANGGRLPWDMLNLLGLFCPMAFAEADPGAAAVFVDELDAGGLQSVAQRNGL